MLYIFGVDKAAVFEDELLLEPSAGKIGEIGDKLVFSQGAEDEFQAGVVADDKFLNQPAGDNRVYLLVDDRGKTFFADDNYRLGVAVPPCSRLRRRGSRAFAF